MNVEQILKIVEKYGYTIFEPEHRKEYELVSNAKIFKCEGCGEMCSYFDLEDWCCDFEKEEYLCSCCYEEGMGEDL